MLRPIAIRNEILISDSIVTGTNNSATTTVCFLNSIVIKLNYKCRTLNIYGFVQISHNSN